MPLTSEEIRLSSVSECSVEDSKTIAKLIFSSEPSLLAYLFGGERSALSFISFACALDDGQFSANRHFGVYSTPELSASKAEASGAYLGPRAICTLWHYAMPELFESFTLSALKHHFSLSQLTHLLSNKQDLDACFRPPEEHELCIGHIAVEQGSRHKGFATTLLHFAIKKAKEMGKDKLVLDVEKSNQAAFYCYLKAGFDVERESQFVPTAQHFVRMSLSLK
ncbi:GNAT family N-acetyltransferase [Glaciecola sp. MH2013]|uniref:GNAT family N-acetyltransferase n=1 Tax=Glaciecola sp. MH2013 TaxID=2785524 RepID=UPI00189F69E1|nr:GNAT family N-acetyltransferase [Glaciecola sp. MH2013]MBF7074419.1 GNAT family N-acetyltransferase [Glaciecola sp. MH2013]